MWNCNKHTLNTNAIYNAALLWYDLSWPDFSEELDKLIFWVKENRDFWLDLDRAQKKENHEILMKKQEEINSAIEAKQLAEHNLKLSKQKLLVLEKKEEKTQEYIDRIHELELKNAALLRENNLKDEVIKRSDKENEQLNKRIDKLIDLKVAQQQVKVIKGTSDVKIIK